ncbi:MAG: glycosyltransferase family 2 protein [Alphaproteobacteria bacterium]|nr:glycosyltransferase family 2 protein [Alphaproteobacteria bacterium]
MTQPFFSVIIPVYNRAAALKKAIASVRAQTCQDFEIVVVDDGSHDNPAVTVTAIGDPRIRFFRQENGGGAAARNRAIDEARGRFIAPLDSDDGFLPHHLAAMKALLEHTTDTVGYARIRVDRGEGCAFLKPPRALREGEHMANYLFCDRGFVPTITTVAPTEIARKVRYHPLRPAEDTDFAIRLFNAGCKFVMAERPGAVWRDIADPGRASATRESSELEQWLEMMKTEIPSRAYHGGRGWAYAKLVSHVSRVAALRLYLTALVYRCYSPRLAMIILLQILLDDNHYRTLADNAIRWLGVGLSEKRLKPDANLKAAA